MSYRPLERRAPVILLMAACVLAPALLALVAVGMGAVAGSTQGLTQATGALSVAAFQGLDRRGIDLAPAVFLPFVAADSLVALMAQRIDVRPRGRASVASPASFPLRL